MFYGLHFTNDSGVRMQVAVNTSNGHTFLRSCLNGQWGGWRRIDVERNSDGTLNEEVAVATTAKSADAAGRLKYPMKITFTGGATGEASFDGSMDIECALAVNQGAQIQAAIDDHVNKYHRSSSSGDYYD